MWRNIYFLSQFSTIFANRTDERENGPNYFKQGVWQDRPRSNLVACNKLILFIVAR